MMRKTGLKMSELVNTRVTIDPASVFRQGSTDVIFGQIWPRPGLTRRQRRWISLTAASAAGAAHPIRALLYGSLNSGEITVAEADEFLLHFACYAGWPATVEVDSALGEVIERIASERGSAPERRFEVLEDVPLGDLAEAAQATRAAVLGAVGPDRADGAVAERTPAAELLMALEYGHVWSRPQLARSNRRLITIVFLAIRGQLEALQAHLRATLTGGEFDEAALREVALQAGFYAGVQVGRALDLEISAALTAVVPAEA